MINDKKKQVTVECFSVFRYTRTHAHTSIAVVSLAVVISDRFQGRHVISRRNEQGIGSRRSISLTGRSEARKGFEDGLDEKAGH